MTRKQKGRIRGWERTFGPVLVIEDENSDEVVTVFDSIGWSGADYTKKRRIKPVLVCVAPDGSFAEGAAPVDETTAVYQQWLAHASGNEAS